MAPVKRAKRQTVAAKHRAFLNKFRHLYDEILAAQGGHCALCPRPPSDRRKLDLDHCHTKMVIRGLLCFRCNRALKQWMADNDGAWLLAAYHYVQGEGFGR